MSEIQESYYFQDLIRPVAIHHGFDFGDRMPGGFGHAYNFLDYHFQEGPAELLARAYLDEAGKVAIRIGVEHLRTDFGLRALVFLAMRYEAIEALQDGRYAPLPADLAQIVAQQVEAHMQAFD